MRTALVIGDIDLPKKAILDPLVAKADVVVAADGGANRAMEAGIAVDWVIGDLDGILPKVLSTFPKDRVLREENPDETDLEKAMRLAHRLGAKDVILTGVIGGRLDHTLGNLAVLAAWHRRVAVRVVDELFETRVVEGTHRFRAPKGTLVSLIAPGGAKGVTTKGLKYPLKDATLAFSPLGVHNEVVANPVSVSARSGTLFVIRSHEVRRRW